MPPDDWAGRRPRAMTHVSYAVAHSSRWYTRCTPLSPACAFGAWQRVNLTATTLFAVSPGRRRGDPTGASRAGRGRAHWGVPRRRAGARPPIGVGPRRVLGACNGARARRRLRRAVRLRHPMAADLLAGADGSRGGGPFTPAVPSVSSPRTVDTRHGGSACRGVARRRRRGVPGSLATTPPSGPGPGRARGRRRSTQAARRVRRGSRRP